MAEYFVQELIDEFGKHYPDPAARDQFSKSIGFDLPTLGSIVGCLPEAEAKQRFVRIDERPWGASLVHPHLFTAPANPQLRGVAHLLGTTYQGLLNLKTLFDQALYSRLIWELQPQTIVEFGAFQGGSSLWLADLQSMHCNGNGTVHAFEYFIKCVSARARRPNLHFHYADLRNLSTLDARLLESLPHPWLVIDDAHVNVLQVLSCLTQFMRNGDYYVIEDVVLAQPLPSIAAYASTINAAGFVVDTFYTDAFGVNMTAAPNAWLRKSA